MRNSTRIAIEIGAVIVVAVIAFFVGRTIFPGNAPQSGGSPADTAPRPSPTKEPVPPGSTVTEKGANVPANVAAPDVVIAAGTDTDIKQRKFTLSISGGQVQPDTVIVRQDDVVDLTFSAVDRDYDMAQPDYGMGFTVPKGGSKTVENQFTQAGKFTFYCPSCGGPDAGPRAYVIVVPRS